MDSTPEHNHGNGDMGHGTELSAFHLSIDLDGDSPGEILETLRKVVLPMLKGGIVHGDNESILTGTSFHFYLAPTYGAGIYLDGHGSVLVVDGDGEILTIVRPDGSEDETAHQLPLSALDWAELHGGLVDIRQPHGPKPTSDQMEFLHKRSGMQPKDEQ